MKPEGRMPHATARDFEPALTDRIAKVVASSLCGVIQLRRHFAYGRLLARVFLHQSELWVLRGATGLPGLTGEVQVDVDAVRRVSGST
jgi:hypothetical protein